jgi:hypothetical protein
MDEARRVLERLDRIECLRVAGSGREQLLPELRALLHEGQEWVSSEGEGTERASTALSALDERLTAAAHALTGEPAREEVVPAEAAA